jgi:4-amino-4-deoxy-L-arabinose transferase-like glycosyltransferase
MVVIPFALLHQRWRDALKAAFYWPGWLLALAVFLPWAVTLTLRDQGDFFKHFLFDHNLSRYSATMESHGGHWWYYLAALPFIVLPFMAWLVPVFKSATRWKAEPMTTYLLLWFAVVLLLFSTSKTQLPHYLLYGCTPLFVLMGLHMEAIRSKWLALLPSALFLLLLCALPLVLPHAMPDENHPYDRGIVEAVIAAIRPGYWLACGGALALVLVSLFHPRLDATQATLRAGLAVSLAAWCGVLPLLAAGQQVPVQQAASHARQLGLATVSYRIHMPSFSVYRGAVTPQRTPVTGELAFTRLDRLLDLGKETGRPFTVVYQAGGIVLVRIE